MAPTFIAIILINVYINAQTDRTIEAEQPEKRERERDRSIGCHLYLFPISILHNHTRAHYLQFLYVIQMSWRPSLPQHPAFNLYLSNESLTQHWMELNESCERAPVGEFWKHILKSLIRNKWGKYHFINRFIFHLKCMLINCIFFLSSCTTKPDIFLYDNVGIGARRQGIYI